MQNYEEYLSWMDHGVTLHKQPDKNTTLKAYIFQNLMFQNYSRYLIK